MEHSNWKKGMKFLSFFINYFEKLKSMRWGTPSDSVEGINFDEIFSAKGFNAARFLKIDNVIEEVKRQNDKVTEKLLANKGILSDLMTICMKPQSYCHPEIGKITNEHTHKAIQILSSLSQQFSDFLFSAPELEEKPDDDQVVTEDLSPTEDTPVNPLFLQLLSLLEQEKPLDETALSYLVKIITSLSYQKPREIILALFMAGNISKNIFEHFYSRSILEWFTRLLQIEDNASFYEKQKLMLFRECIKSIQSQQKEELLLQKLQNYESIFQILLEKIDDRFDKAKYSSMVKQLLTQKDCLIYLFQKISSHQNNTEIKQQILSILEIYLRFSSNHRALNTSKNSENLENSIYEIRLNNDSIKEIKSTIISKTAQILISNAPRKLLRKYLQLVRALIIFDGDMLPEIITVTFVAQLIQVTIQNPTNNILHNLTKEILNESLNRSYRHTATLLIDQNCNKFIQIIRNSSSNNSVKAFGYQNQFFHVFQTLTKKGEQNAEIFKELIKKIQDYEQICLRMKEKEKFYSKLIGGNARKESSCWGDSSAEIVFEKIFPNGGSSEKKIDFFNQKDNTDNIQGNQNHHWFDCGGLPLDSDSSKDQIQNCLSPRSPNNGKVEGFDSLAICEEMPRQRTNSDFKIYLQFPQPQLVVEETSSKIIQSQQAMPEENKPDELDGRSFNTFFVTYESFQLDEVLSEIE